jgi:hypothetical protein
VPKAFYPGSRQVARILFYFVKNSSPGNYKLPRKTFIEIFCTSFSVDHYIHVVFLKSRIPEMCLYNYILFILQIFLMWKLAQVGEIRREQSRISIFLEKNKTVKKQHENLVKNIEN